MITIEGLRNYGADVDEGLKRCMNNEAFYLKMVDKAIQGNTLELLENALKENNLDAAFEAAHALKGVTANLSLTPIYEPVYEITELLRSRTEMDYTPYLEKIIEKNNELKAISE